MRISKHIKIFAKGDTSKWSEKVFVIIKVPVLWKNVIEDFNGEEFVGTFYEKEMEKTKSLELKKEWGRKVIISMLKAKFMTVLLIAG